MTTTQTDAMARDLADLIDLTAYESGVAEATQEALDAWRKTVTPSARRSAVALAAPSGTYSAGTVTPSLLGVAAAASALMTVGALLVSALSTMAGA